jgi:murein DD-endopeptidase MepM/ murein hydrolase activator NlpD
VDLRAGAGQPVRAVRRGTVVLAERVVDRPVLVLRSGGVRFTFEPVRASVPVGTVVAEGQVIGHVGRGGHCDARCLHWGAKVSGSYVDPLSYLPRRAPVLKPPRL